MLFPSTLLISNDLQKSTPILIELGHQSITNNPDVFVVTEYTIENIRSISVFLSRSPYSHDNKIVIIPEANLLNVESQNALLKNLEEPGINNYFILLTAYPNSLIPTILSRCQTIKPESARNNNLPILEFSKSVTESLATSDSLPKDKNEFLAYLNVQISTYQSQLIASPDLQNSNIINKLIKATQMLAANIDTKSTADFLLLS